MEKVNVDANGTWQSISKWGKNEGLNKEQQTAFEILAAKYVIGPRRHAGLSFELVWRREALL